jgi:hypothetical protein
MLRKINYYITNGLLTATPPFILRAIGKTLLSRKGCYDQAYLQERVNYYNKLSKKTDLTDNNIATVKNFKKTGGSAYYFDLFKVIKSFRNELKFKYINGDVIDIPSEPSFVKSRPINGENENSILLKLNAIRHYFFIDNDIPYQEKYNMVVWRGTGFRPNRRELLASHFDHPLCNVARIDKKDPDPQQLNYVLPSMTIKEQLKYKFILSLEGKDVATNLKWIMSSNSLCFTPKLKYETWFMEGKLQGGVHFIEIKDDFSDLIEKMDYYIHHEEEALRIIKNANEWVEQFKDTKREKLLSLLVAQKYFKLTN